MKISEYRKLANITIKDIFSEVIKSDDKEIWKKALMAIDIIIIKYEQWQRGENMFVYREVKKIMSSKYWKKFIKSK